jgi:hypothetical protein
METEHEFTLVLDGISELTPEIMDALYEAGCDDATVSRCNGTVSMDFDRPAASMTEAIVSAISDIRKAGIGARVVRVEPESVGSDVATDRLVGAVNSVLAFQAAIRFDPGLYSLIGLLEPADGVR